MSRRIIVLVLMGGICIGSSIYGARFYLSKHDEQIKAAYETQLKDDLETLAVARKAAQPAIEKARREKKSQDVLNQLVDRGINTCVANPNTGNWECPIPKNWEPSGSAKKARDEILKFYSGYKGGIVPIGTFNPTRVFGDKSNNDDYEIIADKNAVLTYYPEPKPFGGTTSSKGYLDGDIYRRSFNLVPTYYFYDVQNGFLKVKNHTVPKGSKNPADHTEHWSWVSVKDVDTVLGIHELAAEFIRVAPNRISGIYDSPGENVMHVEKIEQEIHYPISISEIVIRDGSIWFKISAEPAMGCGTTEIKDLPQNWDQKWIPYNVNSFVLNDLC